jgi:hypothetical protein
MGNFLVTAEAGGASLAPNVAAPWLSTITPVYIAYGNAWKVAGFQGTLTPPGGTDTTHLKQIHIASINASGFRVETTLYGPFTAGVGVAFKVDAEDLLTASASYTIEFACENEDSVVTTPVYTTTVGVTAPSITGLTATDNVGSRYRYGANSIRTVLSFTPTISNGQYPLTLTAWRNEGSGQKWCGWFVAASSGSVIQIGAQGSPSEGDIIPPTAANGSWTITVAIGAIEKNASIPAAHSPAVHLR